MFSKLQALLRLSWTQITQSSTPAPLTTPPHTRLFDSLNFKITLQLYHPFQAHCVVLREYENINL